MSRVDLLDTATTGLTDDIFDAVDVPIVVVRRDFTVVSFNKAAGNVLGLAPSQINRALRDVPVLARLPGLDAACADIAAGGAPRRVDVRDGHKSFVVRIAPYGSGHRHADGIVLTFMNVTAFRASIDQAIYEREYTKAILNTVSDPIVVLGADQRVQSGNRAFHAMLRVSRDETQGASLYELANGAFELAQLRTQLNALLATSGTFRPLEVEHVLPEIGQRTFMLDARPLSLPGQSDRKILLTFKDITARKQAEAANARLAAIVESSDDAIVGTSLDGIITSWNRGAERVFGYADDDVIGKQFTLLIPPDRHNEEPEILERIRRGERIDHYETVRVRKDGSLVDISLTVSPVANAAGRVVGASRIARDITERKQARARHELLTHEIQHRTKNLFAVVLAVVSRSFVGKHTVEDAQTAVISRLESLCQTHVMLIDKEWEGADLREIVRSEMSPYADRVHVEGPSLMLTASVAQDFALVLHELATNAAKYGALSNATGKVHISWSTDDSNLFTLRWQEQGGPPVRPPMQKGFGSAVLEELMVQHFEIPPRIDFASEGLCYELSGSLDPLTSEKGTRNAEATGQPV
jgi:PAS domain S-box-containing protein